MIFKHRKKQVSGHTLAQWMLLAMGMVRDLMTRKSKTRDSVKKGLVIRAQMTGKIHRTRQIRGMISMITWTIWVI